MSMFARLRRRLVFSLIQVAGSALVYAAPGSLPEPTVEVAESFPDVPALLAPGEQFYLRLNFDTPHPLQLWAKPYADGLPVPCYNNASISHRGRGEALGWFSVQQPGTTIDEVRIRGGGGQPYRERDLLTLAVNLSVAQGPSPSRPTPAWVVNLRATEAALRKNAPHEPTSTWQGVRALALFAGVAVALPLGLFWPFWAVVRWRGRWRFAALVPIVALSLIVLRIGVGLIRDPTSHNLWPFEIAYVALPSLVYMGVLALVRRFIRGAPPPAVD